MTAALFNRGGAFTADLIRLRRTGGIKQNLQRWIFNQFHQNRVTSPQKSISSLFKFDSSEEAAVLRSWIDSGFSLLDQTDWSILQDLTLLHHWTVLSWQHRFKQMEFSWLDLHFNALACCFGTTRLILFLFVWVVACECYFVWGGVYKNMHFWLHVSLQITASMEGSLHKWDLYSSQYCCRWEWEQSSIANRQKGEVTAAFVTILPTNKMICWWGKWSFKGLAVTSLWNMHQATPRLKL